MQTGYLLGMPVASYSLDIGRAHTDFAEGKLQQRLIERQLDDTQIDQFAIISMAGVAAEATVYDEVSLIRPPLQPLGPSPPPPLLNDFCFIRYDALNKDI